MQSSKAGSKKNDVQPVTEKNTKKRNFDGNSLTSSYVSSSSCALKTHMENNKVKRPMNAFILWSKIERKKIADASPKLHHSIISKRLGQRWCQLNDDEKRVYKEEAERLLDLHVKQFPRRAYQPKTKLVKLPPALEDHVISYHNCIKVKPQINYPNQSKIAKISDNNSLMLIVKTANHIAHPLSSKRLLLVPLNEASEKEKCFQSTETMKVNGGISNRDSSNSQFSTTVSFCHTSDKIDLKLDIKQDLTTDDISPVSFINGSSESPCHSSTTNFKIENATIENVQFQTTTYVANRLGHKTEALQNGLQFVVKQEATVEDVVPSVALLNYSEIKDPCSDPTESRHCLNKALDNLLYNIKVEDI